MEEKVFLERDAIKVTSSRIVMGSTTVPMSNVSGVSIQTNKIGFNVGLGFLGTGLVVLLSGGPKDGSLILIGIGILIALVMRVEYELRVETSGSKIKMLVGKNKGRIEEVLNAINEAIVARG